MQLKVPMTQVNKAGSCNRSMKSATTAADSDLMAESCVAESCASFEFVDDEPESRVDRGVDHSKNVRTPA